MAFFKIGNNDFSTYCNSLKVSKSANYNAQTNAAGNTVVDYINSKKKIEVGIIPLNDTNMASLLAAIDNFNVEISFRNPQTNSIEVINCIIPESDIEYYTIQANKVMYNALKLTFTEL